VTAPDTLPPEARCPRCGLPRAAQFGATCEAWGSLKPADLLACRDREIADLRSLLATTSRRLAWVGQQVGDILEILT
jgi:hypothetical protein